MPRSSHLNDPHLGPKLLNALLVIVAAIMIWQGAERDILVLLVAGVVLVLAAFVWRLLISNDLRSQRPAPISGLKLSLEPQKVRPGEPITAAVSFFLVEAAALQSLGLALEGQVEEERIDAAGGRVVSVRSVPGDTRTMLEGHKFPNGTPIEVSTTLTAPADAGHSKASWKVTAVVEGRYRTTASAVVEVA